MCYSVMDKYYNLWYKLFGNTTYHTLYVPYIVHMVVNLLKIFFSNIISNSHLHYYYGPKQNVHSILLLLIKHNLLRNNVP